MAALATLAQSGMNNGGHMNGGWVWAMIVAVVAIVALIVWRVRTTTAPKAHDHSGAGFETATQVLDRRLAQGEITPDEYAERTAILSKQ